MLIINASQIFTGGSSILNGYAILIRGEKILAIGPQKELLKSAGRTVEVLDAKGGVVLPGFVDSHTHLAFAASRLKDFELRSAGATYEEIAKAGGGILQSVRDLRALNQKE